MKGKPKRAPSRWTYTWARQPSHRQKRWASKNRQRAFDGQRHSGMRAPRAQRRRLYQYEDAMVAAKYYREMELDRRITW